MGAPVPTVFNGNVVGTVTFTGSWKRILVENFDPTNYFAVKINGSSELKIPPLTNLGDTFERGIDRVDLVNHGGTPEAQLLLHP